MGSRDGHLPVEAEGVVYRTWQLMAENSNGR